MAASPLGDPGRQDYDPVVRCVTPVDRCSVDPFPKSVNGSRDRTPTAQGGRT